MKTAFPRKSFPYLWFVLVGLLLSVAMLARGGSSFAAQLASPLRQLIGNEGVAQMETVLFGVQDTAKRFQYEAGLAQPEAPWVVNSNQYSVISTQYSVISEQSAVNSTATPSPTAVPTEIKQAAKPALPPAPVHPFTRSPTPWQLTNLQPLGSLEGEGVWSPYLTNLTGKVVGYRTFLQPDPERPFTVVAVVAFDLTQTRLNFVLGTEEPRIEGSPYGTGLIPAEDKVPGRLLAAFNGGFMATHGEYGAMTDGVEALPPRDGLATVAIDQNGRIRIGAWGSDIVASDKLVAWRQNAHMVVQDGQITPETLENSLYYWSGSINNEVVTWRSGLGLSADGNTLYYFAGPGLNMRALGQTMVTAGVYDGMLLDINPYWVHFTAVQTENDEWVAYALLNEMDTHVDRFLRMYKRDFFYVTVKE